MGASERTHGRLAESGGGSLGASPGAAELHGPARPAADSGRGGQSYLAACGRSADRLSAGPHRQNHGESERQHERIKSAVRHPTHLYIVTARGTESA